MVQVAHGMHLKGTTMGQSRSDYSGSTEKLRNLENTVRTYGIYLNNTPEKELKDSERSPI